MTLLKNKKEEILKTIKNEELFVRIKIEVPSHDIDEDGEEFRNGEKIEMFSIKNINGKLVIFDALDNINNNLEKIPYLSNMLYDIQCSIKNYFKNISEPFILDFVNNINYYDNAKVLNIDTIDAYGIVVEDDEFYNYETNTYDYN